MFLLAACAFAALHGRRFMGADIDVLMADIAHHLSLPLTVWMAGVGAGLALLVIGLRPLVRDGDSAPVLSSLVVMAAAAGAMWCGWYLPRAWGPMWSLGSEGFYIAVIAGAATNLFTAFGAQVWMAGYAAVGGNISMLPRAVPFDPDHWRSIIERQAHDIQRLTGEGARIAAAMDDLEFVLRLPDVAKVARRAALTATHPDQGETDGERRTLTERFQRVTAVFDRLERK